MIDFSIIYKDQKLFKDKCYCGGGLQYNRFRHICSNCNAKYEFIRTNPANEECRLLYIMVGNLMFSGVPLQNKIIITIDKTSPVCSNSGAYINVRYEHKRIAELQGLTIDPKNINKYLLLA